MAQARRRAFRPSIERLDDRRLLTGSITPGTLLSAYGLIGESFTTHSGYTIAADGTGLTIAIVEAYYDPYLQHDLATFDSSMGLKPPPFLQQYPRDPSTPRNGIPIDSPSIDPNGGSDRETALDVEWAHAVAPGAAILVYESPSLNISDLATAAYAAARTAPGGRPVVVVSLSLGVTDTPGYATKYDPYFTTPPDHAPVTFVAASGDTVPNPTNLPPDALYPAASPNVVAVGGTSLGIDPNYSLELAWNYDSFPNSPGQGPTYYPPPFYPGDGSGAGLNVDGVKPDYQNVKYPGYPARVFPDVAFDADPASGVLEYATTPESPGHFFDEGGTSLAAPCWAGIITILDQGLAINGYQTKSSEATLTQLYNLYIGYEVDNPNLPQPYHGMAQPTHSYSQIYNGYSYGLTQTGLGSPNGYTFLNEYESGLIQVNPPPGGASATTATSSTATSSASVVRGSSLATIVLVIPTGGQAVPAAHTRVITSTAVAPTVSLSGNGGRFDASRSVLVPNAPTSYKAALDRQDDEPAPAAPSLSAL